MKSRSQIIGGVLGVYLLLSAALGQRVVFEFLLGSRESREGGAWINATQKMGTVENDTAAVSIEGYGLALICDNPKDYELVLQDNQKLKSPQFALVDGTDAILYARADRQSVIKISAKKELTEDDQIQYRSTDPASIDLFKEIVSAKSEILISIDEYASGQQKAPISFPSENAPVAVKKTLDACNLHIVGE